MCSWIKPCICVEVYSHNNSSQEGDKKEVTEDIYHPINFFWRYSRFTLVISLVSKPPNFSTVSILYILIPSFTIFLQNHMVLAA